VGEYRELAPPPGLEGLLACLWGFHDGAVLVVPDGCVDVVFSDGRLAVAGPATAPVLVPATTEGARFGVRFRVGSAGAALGIAADELVDRTVPLADVWGASGRRLAQRVADSATDEERLRTLVAGIAAHHDGGGDGDGLGRHAAHELVRGAPVGRAAREVGLGERHLRRRFERAVGYGPATFVRVQRFQGFLALAERAPHATLGRLAAAAGYADQAHLDRECRRLSGLTPSALLAQRPIVAGDKSDPFKPTGAIDARLAG
jgi:AraC-like DNA-binding protein